MVQEEIASAVKNFASVMDGVPLLLPWLYSQNRLIHSLVQPSSTSWELATVEP